MDTHTSGGFGLARFQRDNLLTQHAPSDIRAQILTAHSAAGRSLDSRAVFGGHVASRLPHARSACCDPNRRRQCANASGVINGQFEGSLLGVHVGHLCYHVRDCAPNTNVMQAAVQITSVKTIAERLKQAREDLGLSQEQVAERAGVSQGTIGNIESGTRKSPRELLAIAAAVKVSPEWLKSGKGERLPASGSGAPPPSPAANKFQYRLEVSKSDFGLLQDVHDLQGVPRLAQKFSELLAELAELREFAEGVAKRKKDDT